MDKRRIKVLKIVKKFFTVIEKYYICYVNINLNDTHDEKIDIFIYDWYHFSLFVRENRRYPHPAP